MDKITKNALAHIVGEKNLSDALIDLVVYAYDFSGHQSRPELVVWPTSTHHVSEILKLANRKKISVVPRGAGTGAAGMILPLRGGIVLDFCRMNHILRVSIEDRLAVVQPGVVHADFQKALAPFGFFFPPDPASGLVATLGGNVATNAGGLRGAKYGTTRDYVLALETVLPDGRVMRIGSNCMKSASGYDLTRLFVGSEGTLGVFTEITLRIDPKPTTSSTALVTFKRLSDAGNAVSQITQSGIITSVCELMDHRIIRLLIQKGLNIPDSDAMILAETEANTQADADFQMEKMITIFEQNHAIVIKQATSQSDIEELWRARKSLGGIVATYRPNFLVEDVSVPISKMTDLLEGIEAIANRYHIEIVNFGHAGDGNLHPHFLYDAADPDEVDRVEGAVADLFEMTCRMGGTLTGEHGIGLSKAPFMPLEHDPVAIDVMRALKNLLDPNHILNPGKMGMEK